MLCTTLLFAKRAGIILSVLFAASCSKENTSPPPSSDPCNGKTITITVTPSPSAPCGNTGSIDVSATGSTGFMYKLNTGGAYQASGIFGNVSEGNHTVFVKDAEGCEKSKEVAITTAGTAGPLFTAVKNLISTTCQPCHNNTVQNGGRNFQVDCNIVASQTRIKVRAVDEGTMPQGGPELTPTQKAVITNWINAGGKFTD